ncbi:g1116 [Coccomyxa viridis]|uniref:G1116 protein n=1 Tax=Coccomyxa viridis TaxID=1274662 RepID=A0ABP1FH95_9CHLO
MSLNTQEYGSTAAMVAYTYQVAVTQDDDEMTGFCPEAKVTCKAAKLDALKHKVAEEISKSWAEHRASGWADPVPAAKRSETEIESDYGDNFFVCVMDVPVDV